MPVRETICNSGVSPCCVYAVDPHVTPATKPRLKELRGHDACREHERRGDGRQFAVQQAVGDEGQERHSRSAEDHGHHDAERQRPHVAHREVTGRREDGQAEHEAGHRMVVAGETKQEDGPEPGSQ
jgi:hypothetical protein